MKTHNATRTIDSVRNSVSISSSTPPQAPPMRGQATRTARNLRSSCPVRRKRASLNILGLNILGLNILGLGILGWGILGWGLAFATPAKASDDVFARAQERDDQPERRFRGPGRGFDGPNNRQGRRRRTNAPPPLWGRMTREEKERVIEFVQENLPELSEHLTGGDATFRPWMRRHVGEVVEMMRLMEEDPERGELVIRERRLDIQMNLLAHRFATSRNERVRQRIEREMTEACVEWVELRHRRRELQIEALEQRLRTLRKRHDRASKMIEQRVEIEVAKRLERAEEPITPIPKRD